MQLEIRDSDEADAASIVELRRESDDVRVLSIESMLYKRRTEPEQDRVREVVAVEAGRIVALGACGLDTWAAAPGSAWANVTVTGDRRRQGIGSAIGDVLLEHLRSLGALRATSFIRHTDEAERWAAARGWSRVLTGPLIAVDPRRVPPPELPDGFRCVALSELTPEALYEAVCEAALDEPSAIERKTMPFEDLVRDWEDPDLDLEASAAVLDGDAVAAFSFLKVAGDRGQHGFTGTARAYRGRGLATAVKRQVLRTAAARGVTRVTTSNAEQNAPMRAINRRLGFEPIGEHVILARDL